MKSSSQGEIVMTEPLPVPGDDVLARRIDDEVVLVNLSTNEIFALNPTGARFWELLSAGNDRAAIESALMDEYDAPRPAIEESIDALLVELRRERLVVDPAAPG
jgi:hypothetical protein